MRAWILSDLHVDIAPFEWPTPPEHDVLIVAGDVCERLPVAIKWLRDTAPTDRPIVYVPGNHDAWRMRWPRDLVSSHDDARLQGVTLLASGESAVIAGARFIGATLWVDFRLHPYREFAARAEYDHGAPLDQRRIQATQRGAPARWLSRDAQQAHVEHRAAIEAELARPHEGPTVVVTHHAPHPASLKHGEWDDDIDACYASDLTALMQREAAPALWVHGHTHLRRDYVVGGTRVVSNPRGYGTQNADSFDPTLVLEI